jgi:hypothetical protein
MLVVHRLATRVACAAFAAATLMAFLPDGAGAAAAARSPYKRLQVHRLAEEPMRERREHAERREFTRERLRELRRLARAMKKDGRTSLRTRGESARPFTEDEDFRPGRPAPARPAEPMSAGAVTGPPRPNVRCNNTAGDGALDGQCETSIVRWNNYMIAAWNDGSGFSDGSNQTQGWGTSTDGGATWTDRGTFPIPGPYTGWVWTSDPVLAVNPATGSFYFSALGDATPSLSAIGVLKGRFTGSSFAWGPVSVTRTVPTSSAFLDKEWIAVDPASGRVYLTYTNFVSNYSQIEFQAADSALTTWTAPLAVSLPAEDGWVQGSRPAVGPGGTIYVVYYLIGPVDLDYFRVCKSTNGGTSFSAPVDAVSFYANFGTGAPGFNRDMGIQFPSIAVDRSGGAHDGRLYLSWAESLNWYNDGGQLGSGGRKTELEPNNTFETATPLALGQTAAGTINASSDINDWYGITLGAGQSIIVTADTLGAGTQITMRLFATDGTTRLAYTTAIASDILSYGPPVMVCAAPTAGRYYLRIAGAAGGGVYRVSTGPASRGSERGRDQRDAFVCSSDNGGVTWSTPVRVSNSAVGFDDWLPEVAVGADGQVYAGWYDFRDATPSTNGGESSVYLARSSDGGATWAELGATSDAKTAWTTVNTNILPNQGDYLSLFADAGGLSAAWSDGRGGTPDVYMSHWTLSEASTLPALVSATASRSQVQLVWRVGTAAGFAAQLQRRVVGASAWDSIGTLFSAADSLISYADTGVLVGQTYEYRLGVMQGGTEYFYGQVTVHVSGSLALAGAWPNPATNSSVIVFTLVGSGPATLDLLDLGGRRVLSRAVGEWGPGTHNVPLTSGERLRPGVYFVRLTQGGDSKSKRIVVL